MRSSTILSSRLSAEQTEEILERRMKKPPGNRIKVEYNEDGRECILLAVEVLYVQFSTVRYLVLHGSVWFNQCSRKEKNKKGVIACEGRLS